MNVSFFSNRIKFKLENKSKVIKWLNETAHQENAAITELSYVFCSDRYLHKINIDFLNHDTLTDIITFDYCPPPLKNKPKIIIGEIYISIPRVIENSKKFNCSFDNELHRVIIHGFLHLCGYKDKSKLESKVMRAKEDFYLENYFTR
jgi:probable rRNA maturation factor